MTGKTLSPLGEGRIAEGSKLRVPLGEEGLRRRASTNPRPGAGSGKRDEDAAGVKAGAGANTSPRPGAGLLGADVACATSEATAGAGTSTNPDPGLDARKTLENATKMPPASELSCLHRRPDPDHFSRLSLPLPLARTLRPPQPDLDNLLRLPPAKAPRTPWPDLDHLSRLH
jgi:hypothetical protein